MLNITDDTSLEDDEIFTAVLMGNPDDSSILTVDPSEATITILDNDGNSNHVQLILK